MRYTIPISYTDDGSEIPRIIDTIEYENEFICFYFWSSIFTHFHQQEPRVIARESRNTWELIFCDNTMRKWYFLSYRRYPFFLQLRDNDILILMMWFWEGFLYCVTQWQRRQEFTRKKSIYNLKIWNKEFSHTLASLHKKNSLRESGWFIMKRTDICNFWLW